MRKVKEVIVVEGRYDKNTLRQTVDAAVLETGGFSVFNNRQKLELLRRLAEKQGLILLTDSDGAGFVIRNYLKGALPKDRVKQAYIPNVYGKERRKRSPGKEGKLGVEGMTPQILLTALEQAGATFEDGEQSPHSPAGQPITKLDLFELGLSGGEGSSEFRKRLLSALNFPEHLSSNAMLEVLNLLFTRDEFYHYMNHDLK